MGKTLIISLIAAYLVLAICFDYAEIAAKRKSETFFARAIKNLFWPIVLFFSAIIKFMAWLRDY